MPAFPTAVVPVRTNPPAELLAALEENELEDLFGRGMLTDNKCLEGVSIDPPVPTAPPGKKSVLRKLKRAFPSGIPRLSRRGWVILSLLAIGVAIGSTIWLEPIAALQLLRVLFGLGNSLLMPLFLIAVGRSYARAVRLAHTESGVFGAMLMILPFYARRFTYSRQNQLRDPSLFWRIVLYAGVTEIFVFIILGIALVVFMETTGPEGFHRFMSWSFGGEEQSARFFENGTTPARNPQVPLPQPRPPVVSRPNGFQGPQVSPQPLRRH